MEIVTDKQASTRKVIDTNVVRQDFPILSQIIHDHPLAYLDNGASSQKPYYVLNAIQHFYHEYYANVHRGIHTLSERATAAYETARVKVQRFIHARSSDEIIFVRGTTEAINLVAQSYARSWLRSNDVILITAMEHHSNIVPWQLVCEQTGANLKWVPLLKNGELDLAAMQQLLDPAPRLLALTHVSNVLGTINPIKKIIDIAHANGVPVLIDGAQAAPHVEINVQDLDCDFYAFSGHKMYGPTGIGILFAKEKLLEQMPPYHGGGEMIEMVSLEYSSYKKPPHKFEAGTPHIAGAIGLGAAVDYIDMMGIHNIAEHERQLLNYGHQRLLEIDGLKIIGTSPNKSSIVSFSIDGIHPHDIATILDMEGIAVRAGHHCAMPLMEYFGVTATTRASFAIYNSREEIDRLVEGLHKAKAMFR